MNDFRRAGLYYDVPLRMLETRFNTVWSVTIWKWGAELVLGSLWFWAPFKTAASEGTMLSPSMVLQWCASTA